MVNGVAATLYSGGETLEVVGESYRQEGLWGVVGQRPTNQRVHHEAVALLVPETGNPYDANAIAVWIADTTSATSPATTLPHIDPAWSDSQCRHRSH